MRSIIKIPPSSRAIRRFLTAVFMLASITNARSQLFYIGEAILSGSGDAIRPTGSYFYSPDLPPPSQPLPPDMFWQEGVVVSDSNHDGYGSSARAESHSAAGLLRNFAHAVDRNPHESNYVGGGIYLSSPSFNRANSQAGFADSFIMSSAGLDGRPGVIEFTLKAHGTYALNNDYHPGASTSGSVEINYSLYKSLELIQEHNTWHTASLAERRSSGFDELITFTLPFTWGSKTDFLIMVEAGAIANAGPQTNLFPVDNTLTGSFSEALIQMMHTTSWGGFTSVYNEAGEVVTDYQYFAQSGIDYVHAIPEPASAAQLFLGGLVLLRQRKRKPLSFHSPFLDGKVRRRSLTLPDNTHYPDEQ